MICTAKRLMTGLLLVATLFSLCDLQAANARLKFLIGRVEYLPLRQTTWRNARLNQIINSGDRLRTLLNSRAELQMPDGSVIKIQENSVFDVKDIRTPERDREDKMSFTLWAGSIWAKFKKLVDSRQTRQIESPSAVVAVRGTTLEVDVDQQQTTRVRVLEGRVVVRSRQVAGQVELEANQQSVIERGKAPTPAQKITPAGPSPAPGGAGLTLNVQAGKLQFVDPAVLSAGVPLSGRVSPGALLTANDKPLTVAPNGSFKGRAAVREGLNEIRLVARKGGQEKTQILRLFVNTRKPEIRLSKPLVTGFINRRDYSLSGAVFDATPRDRVTVFMNDEMVAEVMGRGSFNRTIILNEGQNEIRILARDRSGNQTQLAERIFLDTVKPIITVTEPARAVFVRLEPPRPPEGNYNFEEERFMQQIRGLIIDPEPSSGIKRMAINGTEITPESDGSFATEIPLKRGRNGRPGENRLNIVVEDLAGNITRDSSRMIIIR